MVPGVCPRVPTTSGCHPPISPSRCPPKLSSPGFSGGVFVGPTGTPRWGGSRGGVNWVQGCRVLVASWGRCRGCVLGRWAPRSAQSRCRDHAGDGCPGGRAGRARPRWPSSRGEGLGGQLGTAWEPRQAPSRGELPKTPHFFQPYLSSRATGPGGGTRPGSAAAPARPHLGEGEGPTWGGGGSPCACPPPLFQAVYAGAGELFSIRAGSAQRRAPSPRRTR